MGNPGFKINWLLKANTLLVVLLMGIMIWGCGSSIFSFLSPFAMMGGIVLAPCIAALGIYQFDAVFGKNHRSAFGIAVLYFIGCAFILFAFISNLLESSLTNISILWEFGGICLLLFVYGIFSAIINLKWSRKIKEQENQLIRNRFYKKRVVALIILYILSFAAGGISGYRYGHKPPELAEHVNSVSWLPPSANDVCYYLSYFYTAYEFNISQKDFLEWAAKNSWNVTPIKDEPVYISRYSDGQYYRERHPESANKEISKSIINGYFYGYRRGDGGGEDVAYDNEKGRAYYFRIPR